MKKILALVLAAMMVLAMIACGGSTTPAATDAKTEAPKAETQTETKADEPAAEAKSYQLIGIKEEGGAFATMTDGAFMLNLEADGTASLNRYKFANFDHSPAAENPSYDKDYMTGTWKQIEKDGLERLQIKVAAHDASGAEVNPVTAYADEVAGEWVTTINVPIAIGAGFTRDVELKGGETKLYADGDAFIQAYKRDFDAPEHVAEFVSEGNPTAYLFEDGKLSVYVNFVEQKTGTWSNGADGLKIVVDGKEAEITTDGNAASFVYTYDVGNGTLTDVTLTCADASAIPAAEAAEAEATEAEPPAADAPYTMSVSMGGFDTTAELTLNADNTAKLHVFMDFDVTYEKVGNAVILSLVEEIPAEDAQKSGLWMATPHTLLLDDEAKTMTGIANAWTDGLKAFYAIDETTMTVALPAYGMSADGFTYELSEDGATLTVTAPAELSPGFTQVWGGAGLAKTFTVDGQTVAEAQ